MQNEILKYKFWFILSFSALLVVTFGLYIPLRFQHQSLTQEGFEMPMEMHENEHGSVQYHEEEEVIQGLVTNLNITPAPFNAGVPLRLDFFVNRKPENIPVINLQIDHDKLMHVIGVRDDMNEFFHIHPEPTKEPGIFSVNYNFPNPGLYKIWSEIKNDGINHTFGHPEFSVEGAGEKFKKKIDFGRNVITGFYQVALRLGESAGVGKEVEILFDIHTLNSSEAELEDYLASPMHLTIIKDDWSQFIHTHPEGVIEHGHTGATIFPEVFANGGGHDTSEEGHGVSFRVVFPEPGLYKAFAQFRPKGINLPPDKALLAEFWIKAEEKTGFQASPWWINLIWSSLAIVILSWLIARYLRGVEKKKGVA